MFQIKKLDTPESVPFSGGVMNLTHTRISLNINPSAVTAVVVTKNKGYLNNAGRFIDWGDAEVSTMDAQGLDDLIAATEGGKRAGVFRTDDIMPAIAKRAQDIEAAEKAAAEKAEADRVAKLKP